jgi:transposase
MYQALPSIQETAEELRDVMKAEHRPSARQRVHALYLVASGQARSRSATARLLGVHRDTIGAWFRLYVEGGRDRLLDLYSAPGKTSRVPPDGLAALRARLEQPDGFASYGEIQTWLAETHGVQMQYAALHKLVAYKLKARPKVVRPRHIKKSLKPKRRLKPVLPTRSAPSCPQIAPSPSRFIVKMRPAVV